MFALALGFQLFCAGWLTYVVWRNLTKNEVTHNWRPHWRPEPRYSGQWWFAVIHNVAALVIMTGVFIYCLIKFVIIGE